MLGRCSCPRVIRVYGVYTQDPRFLGMVVEKCECDLRQLITEADLDDGQKWVILRDIAEVRRNHSHLSYRPAFLFTSCLV